MCVVDQLAPIGLIYATASPGEAPRFAGTCFLYQSDLHALTAAHCVAGDYTFYCIFPRLGRSLLPVQEIKRHPTADIACLKVEEWDVGAVSGVERTRREGVTPQFAYWGLAAWGLGLDVWTYGFPPEVAAAGGSIPQPRVFKGHIQTTYPYVGEFAYEALELSFAAPRAVRL